MDGLFIVDLDDTIIPTRWLRDNKYKTNGIPIWLRVKLNHLEKMVRHFLEEMTNYGTVVIVTNASVGWAKMVFIDAFRGFQYEINEADGNHSVNLQKQKINIISCRPFFGKNVNPKESTIHDLINKYNPKFTVCVGDGQNEVDSMVSYYGDSEEGIMLRSKGSLCATQLRIELESHLSEIYEVIERNIEQ